MTTRRFHRDARNLGLAPLITLLAGWGCASAEPTSPVAPIELSLLAPYAALAGESRELRVELSRPARVLWTFGDGETLTVPAAESHLPVKRAWTHSGSFTVRVSVEDAGMSGGPSAAKVVQVLPKAVFHPKRSSTLAHRGDVVVALCEDAGSLTVARRVDGVWQRALEIETCERPRTVALEPGDAPTLVAVACEDDQLRVHKLVDGATWANFTFAWGSHPYGVLWREDGLFVTLRAQGKVARLNLTTTGLSLASAVTVVQDARGLASLPDDALIVSRWRSPAARGELAVWRPDSSQIEAVELKWADLAPADSESGGVPSYLDQVLMRPQADEGWVPGLHANNRDGLWRNGVPLSHDSATRAMLARLKLQGGVDGPVSVTEATDQRLLFEDRGLLQAGAIDRRGAWLFVTDRGARSVERFDLTRGGVQAGAILGLGYAPQGVEVSDDGEWLMVDAQLSRQLLFYRLAERGPLPQAPAFVIPLVTQEPLPDQVLRGKQLFNDSFDTRLADDSYIACAHCHLDGESDGRVWDFTDRGEGLRNTPSLLGRAGLGHGPLHWSANFDEVQDFEADIRGHFGGAGLMTDDQFEQCKEPLGPPKAGRSKELDALAAYLSSLTSYPRSPGLVSNGALSEAAERGKALFGDHSLGCVKCHAGPHLTDSGWIAPGQPRVHDVGTLTPSSGQRLGASLSGLDTPTLRGLWNSAPYLHDGRASSLEALWSEHNVDDAHGKTSHLSAAQLSDLNAYLMSL